MYACKSGTVFCVSLLSRMAPGVAVGFVVERGAGILQMSELSVFMEWHLCSLLMVGKRTLRQKQLKQQFLWGTAYVHSWWLAQQLGAARFVHQLNSASHADKSISLLLGAASHDCALFAKFFTVVEQCVFSIPAPSHIEHTGNTKLILIR